MNDGATYGKGAVAHSAAHVYGYLYYITLILKLEYIDNAPYNNALFGFLQRS